jgi:DNA-binding beta-propeller fold protein YncE
MNMEQAPHALLVVNDRLWVVGSTWVQAIGLTPQNRVSSLRVAISGDTLAYDGRLVWVGLTGRAEVVGLNPVDASVVVTLPMSGSASPLAFDGQHLWVAVYSSTTGSALEVIDPITYSRVKTVYLDEGIVADPITAMLVEGKKLWVAYNLTVQAVDVETLRPAAKQNFGVINSALVAADQHLWLATTLGTSSAGFVLKLMTGGQENYLPAGALGNVPSALATDGQRVWVAYQHDGEVQAIDPVSGEHLLTMQVGAGPTALAFDGSRVWVANEAEDTIRAIYPNLP